MRMRISVVIPAHCEQTQLPTVVAAVDAELRSLDLSALSYEIVIIDDGSTDETWSVLEGLCEEYPALRGVRLTRNFGKEAALSAGLDEARGAAVITMDADMQHPPSLIPQMVKSWQEGQADIAGEVKVGVPIAGVE